MKRENGIRLAGSASFSEAEIAALDAALRAAESKRPHPPPELVRAPEIGTLLAKIQGMRRAVMRARAERQRLIALGTRRLGRRA